MSDRGQLVVLAAVALALALVPIATAYLQLGYHGDREVMVEPTPAEDAERLLDRGIHDAAAGIADSYDWADRSAAVATVRGRLEPTVAAVERGVLPAGTARTLAFNDSRAAAWASANCPGGPDRQFGACEAVDGVVVQNRTGGTHVLAVAVDVRVTGPDGTLRVRTILELDGR